METEGPQQPPLPESEGRCTDARFTCELRLFFSGHRATYPCGPDADLIYFIEVILFVII